MHLHFEWDANKAASNLRKHGVSFEEAAEVFRDPLALTLFDEKHGQAEECWITGNAKLVGWVEHSDTHQVANARRI